MVGSERIEAGSYSVYFDYFLFSCGVTNIRTTTTPVKVIMRSDFIIEQIFVIEGEIEKNEYISNTMEVIEKYYNIQVEGVNNVSGFNITECGN